MSGTASIIDGKAIAEQIHQETTAAIQDLRNRGVVPGLAVILVGSNPASVTYVRMKEKKCAELGVASFPYHLPEETSEQKLLDVIAALAVDQNVHGILVQLPLPPQIDPDTVLRAIPPEKDVDGFHPVNLGRLLHGQDCLVPCTPAGVQELLLRSGNDPSGKHVVVVGRSNIVGKPLAALLMQKREGANATVTVCHSRTRDLAEHTRRADILVAAMGSPKFVKAEMVGQGAVVIDVGVNRVEDPTAKRGYRLVGDVDFDAVSEVAAAITPVPGGVGPMTIAMLMKNTVKAAQWQLAGKRLL